MLFSQELLKTMFMQSMQMLGGGQAAALQLQPGARPVTNPAVVGQVDSVVRNTIASMDSQLASVGITLTGLPGAGSNFTTATNGPIPRPAIPSGQTALTAGRQQLPGQTALPGQALLPGQPAIPGQTSLLGGITTIGATATPVGQNPLSALGVGTPLPTTPLTPGVVRAADVSGGSLSLIA